MIGERIRLARDRLKMPRSQLAERVGVSGAAVTLWEQGGQSPSAPKLNAVAHELGMSVEYLLGGPENPIPPAGTLDAVTRAARHAAAAIMGVSADKVEVEVRIRA